MFHEKYESLVNEIENRRRQEPHISRSICICFQSGDGGAKLGEAEIHLDASTPVIISKGALRMVKRPSAEVIRGNARRMCGEHWLRVDDQEGGHRLG
jgi:hypothetical protein